MSALYPINVQNDYHRFSLIFLNHDRNFSTFLTIRHLVEHERVADIYALSRAMFESIVSMGLLSKAIITDDLNRYNNYQFVETYKFYSHLEKLGFAKLSGISSSEVSLLKTKKDEFLSKYGKNILTWTGKSLEENVRLLDKWYSPTCNEKHFYEYLYCQVYRRGSPASHSSFSGLAKGVVIEKVDLPGALTGHRFKANEPHLIFSCFHSLLVFLSSIRFMGHALQKVEVEQYFHKVARYIVAE